ncbi:MarR family transcriptional regulator [Kribbella antibiotica]|uniref:MarR family transcriptional regulator n=2 Tax=Kribbella antibiotica TaxID=190195 RepID=A0A4R4ZGM8_9ACTN|nr:MarR family transcriptional regulator [Kribbella antibiotica]
MSDDNKPIGWWLKELDRLLESSFEQLLAADGLTRRQWQALNAAAGPKPIAAALAPFLVGNRETLTAVTDPLTERGWLTGDELTPSGHAALTELTAKVQEQRRLVAAGISDEEYAATIDVLRRMTRNLSA